MICSLAYSANALEVGEVRRWVRERERVDVDIGEVHRERTHLAEDSVGREACFSPRHFQGRSCHLAQISHARSCPERQEFSPTHFRVRVSRFGCGGF